MTTAPATHPMPVGRLCAFTATTDAARCRDFYAGVLGLRLAHEDAFALVFDSGGVMLRIQKVPGFTPQPFTAVGWNVNDLDAAVNALVAAGVRFEKFPWFKQDERGIVAFNDSARVAWFKDPDGNIVSVAQVPY